MHVAWGWAHGLMQYRDLFDNHMPLFHMLSAPLFAFAGDDARLLFVARLTMIPLFLATLVLVYLIARSLFEEGIAWWSTALVALFPPFFLGSLEYRTDDLWVVCWLAVIAVLVGQSEPTPKALAVGLLLGAAFGVSLKSILFVVALTTAAIATPLMTRRFGRVPPRDFVRYGAIVAAGALVVPAGIAGGFAIAGAWKPFFYGVVEHNQFPFEHAWRVLWFIPLYAVIRLIALAIARSHGDAVIVRRRLFVFLACAAFFVALTAFWPMSSAESFLPFWPVAIVLVTGWLKPARTLIPAFCGLVAIAVILLTAKPWRNDAQREIEVVSEIVSMTTPSEPVMDMKGESIFRVRPYYLVLDAITHVKMRFGMVRDEIAETLIRTATHVVVGENFPPRTRRFVLRNYVPWGAVRVAGVRLPDLRGDGAPIVFSVGIPGRYAVIDDRGMVGAKIDGVWVNNDVALTAGRHELVSFTRTTHPLVIWSGALRWRPSGGSVRRRSTVRRSGGSRLA